MPYDQRDPVHRPAGVRTVNTGTVLDLLRRQRQTSRTELIERSGLSKATVSGIVADLLDRGFAKEVGTLQRGRGRGRVLLEFDPMARSVLGAQIEDDLCSFVLTDLDGRPHARTSRPLASTDPGTVLDALGDGIAELRTSGPAPVLGIGIGAPGQVDRAGRRILLAISHGWSDLPLADIIERRCGLPVVAANRAKVAALGQLGGTGEGRPKDLIYVFLGTGVVAGLVLDGHLYFGRDGGAGDIGHVTVDPGGELCGCGNRGCLHTVAAESAVLALARSKARRAGPTCLLYTLTEGRLGNLTSAILAEAARRADPPAVATLEEVGTHLGVVIANLANTLNPDAVIIGGPGAGLGTPLLDRIHREVRQRALSEAVENLDLTASAADHESGAVGAATLWLTRAQSRAGARSLLAEPADLAGPPAHLPEASRA